jgi:hypothetical protein
MSRPLYAIAADINLHFRKLSYGARPYVDAMFSLNSIDDTYGCDDARSIVLYFLSNAGAWRGDAARRIKGELRAMLDDIDIGEDIDIDCVIAFD